MDSDNLQEPLLQNDGPHWRTVLQQDSRERFVNQLMEILKRNLPLSGQEEIKKIAVRYEEEIYTEATSLSDYLRKISVKSSKMEADSKNHMANSLQSNAASNSENAQDPASQSMQSHMQNHVQNNVPSTGVPNSAGSTPALPPVDGKSQGTITMPSVPVQNPNVQNMLNTTPFTLRHPMMQTNSSMFQFGQSQIQGGQQQAVPGQLQKRNLFQTNKPTLQQWIQQPGLRLHQQANTLPGDTQQRIQSTGPMIQGQTTIDQRKQLSQSQGNMPDSKLASQSMQSQIKNQLQNNVPSTGVPNSAGMSDSLQSNAASNGENNQDIASQSMQSQLQNQVHQLPTATVSDQSQVQSQNIQNNIASTGVPNSAGSTPAPAPVDGKSQGTMPRVPVQNPNMQNMFNATPSALRNPMLQGWPTTGIHLLQKMKPLQTNQPTLQQLMQQQQLHLQQQQLYLQRQQLHLQQQVNTLPGDTQQRIQSTGLMSQGQTTIDQLKQLSHSQGNMPDFKLGINLDSEKKADTALKKRQKEPVSSLQQGQLSLNKLAMQQSQQQQPQMPSNEGQMNSQTQPMNIQGPTMPTQPNNLTSLQQNTLASGSSSVSNPHHNVLGGLQLHGGILNQTQQVAMNSLQHLMGGSQPMTSSISSSQNRLTALHSNSNAVQPQQIQMLSAHAQLMQQQQMLQQYMQRLSIQQQLQQWQMQQRLFQEQQQQQQQTFQKQSEQLLILQLQQQQQQTSHEQSRQLTTAYTVLVIYVLVVVVMVSEVCFFLWRQF